MSKSINANIALTHSAPTATASEARKDSTLIFWKGQPYRICVYERFDDGTKEKIALTEKQWEGVVEKRMAETLEKVSDKASDFLPAAVPKFSLRLSENGMDVNYGEKKISLDSGEDKSMAQIFFKNVLRLNPVLASSLKTETETVDHAKSPVRMNFPDRLEHLAGKLNANAKLLPDEFAELQNHLAKTWDGKCNMLNLKTILEGPKWDKTTPPDLATFIPVELGDRTALLYYNTTDTKWHYFDPSGKPIPVAEEFVKALGQLGTNAKNIEQDDSQKETDPAKMQQHVLFQMNKALGGSQTFDEWLDSFEDHLTTFIDTAIASRKTAEAPDLTTIEPLSKADGPRPSATTPASSSISVFHGSALDALYQFSEEKRNPLVWSFADPTTTHDRELQASTSLGAISDSELKQCKNYYLPDASLLTGPRESLYQEFPDGTDKPTFAVGFAGSPPLDGEAIEYRGNTPIRLKAAIHQDLEKRINSFLQIAIEKSHALLLIPEMPLDNSLTGEEKRFIDQEIAKLFLERAQSEYPDGKIVFAVSKETNRNPAASYYGELALRKSSFGKVERRDHTGSLIDDPSPTKRKVQASLPSFARIPQPAQLAKLDPTSPVGIVNEEGNDCFINSYMQAFILDDPLLEKILKGNSDTKEIGSFIDNYRKATKPVHGSRAIRDALQRLTGKSSYLAGQHDPTEAFGFLNDNPAFRTDHFQTETIKNYWEVPAGMSVPQLMQSLDAELDDDGIYTTSVNPDFNGIIPAIYTPNRSLEELLSAAIYTPHERRELSTGEFVEGKSIERHWEKVADHLIVKVGAFQGDLNSAQKLELSRAAGTITQPFPDGKEHTYELTSFIQHRGTTGGSGHFVAYVKRGENYFECNDSKAKKIDANTFFEATKTAYQAKYTRSS